MNPLDFFMRASAFRPQLLSRLKLWRCTQLGERIKVLGSVYVVGGGRIELGDDVLLDGRLVPIELHAGPDGLLIIGHGSVLEAGVSIEAQQRVELGPGCRLRAFSKLMDNNFHPVAGSRHRRPPSQPVKLESAVDVGERSIVLPGAWLEARVTLGPGVVIARRVKSGATVTAPKPVEPRSESKGLAADQEAPEPESPARPRALRVRPVNEGAVVAS